MWQKFLKNGTRGLSKLETNEEKQTLFKLKEVEYELSLKK